MRGFVHPSRALSIALLVVLALLACGSVAFLQFWTGDGNAAAGSPVVPPASVTGGHASAEPEPTTATAPATRAEASRRELAGTTPASGAKPKVLLVGKVVDAEGRGVAQAIVCLDHGRPGGTWLAETGSAGEYAYTIEALDGDHELFARAEGTALARATIRVPRGVERFEVPPLVLPAGLVIRGRLLDAQGEPVVSGRVMAYAEQGPSADIFSAGKRMLIGVEDVLTGKDGAFAMRGVENVLYTVYPYPEQVAHPGSRWEPAEVKAVVPDGTTILEFRLVSDGIVRGIVLDALTGLPIQRFRVMETEVRRADGRFEVPRGKEQRFEVVAPGYLPAADDDLPAIANDGERVVRLLPDPDVATLEIVARDESGQPVQDFDVGWISGWRFQTETASDSDGTLRIPGISSGKTQFSVTAEGRAIASFAVELARGTEKRIEVRLVSSSPVHLRVILPNGNPARQVTASIEDEQGERPPWSFRFTRVQGKNPPISEWSTDGGADASMTLFEADGLIVGLRPGRYRLLLDGAGVPARTFTVSSDAVEELTWQLPAGQEK